MKSRRLFSAAALCAALLAALPAAAQYAGQSCTAPDAATVRQAPAQFGFRMNGTFRVMQLTDLHMTADFRSDHLFPMLGQLIQYEQPDLIVITGDLIYAPCDEVLWRRLGDFLASQHVPYAITLGNHDAERIPRSRVYEIVRTLPLCVNAAFNPEEERQGDFVIPIGAFDDPERIEALLYVMDTNDYNADDRSYAGFEPAQIAWYEATSARIEREAGRKPNALMFFHVPLHEFAEAVEAGNPLTGFRLENECPARDNAGMFDAVLRRGDVCGIFAGHDHANNYVTEYRGVALGFGRYSGTFGEYQELLSGARMFELKAGERGFTTWERLANNSVARRRTFPTPKPADE